MKVAKNHIELEVIFKGLKTFCISSHVKQTICPMLSKPTKWVNVLSNIDVIGGYVHDFVHMTLHVHFFGFIHANLDVDVDTFNTVGKLVFLAANTSRLSLFCKLSKS
jgi:hypothetical protein